MSELEFLTPTFRYFNKCETEEEFNKVDHSPFIKNNDLVFYNGDWYVASSLLGMMKLFKCSTGDKLTKINFFHKFDIDDKVKFNDEEYVVEDFHYHYKSKESFYVLKNENKVFKAPVVEVDLTNPTDDKNNPVSTINSLLE